ncbi:class I SAM-dependent methyltransferase [Phenylobacterium deserti]|uniref:Methyltransferase domain-containing protein n=1 Tax=Phenylobacterium deserti TaxID=1914756 RepID=A0A328ARP6_9CAUL|nr:class I SAM-dependent methyltransferase [Phenylobacterium deserti]RAK56931.1 hypothetical protein DJ018_02890 [Phenylobacterium deserti]
MAQVRPYYVERGLSAAFYDVVTATDASLPGDIDIYAGLAAPGGEVLELGCGTGRITEALALRGYLVTGVDLAPSMLKQAEARRAALPPEAAERIRLLQGDMTDLNLKRSFQAVLCPFFTLAHVPAGTAWKNTFRTMAAHLEPGGMAAVHLPLAEHMRGPPPAREAIVLDEALPGGGRLQLHVLERRFRERIGRFDQVIEYVERDARGAVVRRSAERLTYYVADPVPFAEQAGFVLDRPPIDHGAVGKIFIFKRI